MVTINYRDSRPIYGQVKDGIRRLIVEGVVSAGDRLPSVRELASQLAINPNTIQRAYRELESEKYIYSIPGKGSFVEDKSGADKSRLRQLLAQFDELVKELGFLEYGSEMLCERIMNGGGNID